MGANVCHKPRLTRGRYKISTAEIFHHNELVNGVVSRPRNLACPMKQDET